eukprot:jgi/Bigna1/73943/fgenesh1_pg.26_\
MGCGASAQKDGCRSRLASSVHSDLIVVGASPFAGRYSYKQQYFYQGPAGNTIRRGTDQVWVWLDGKKRNIGNTVGSDDTEDATKGWKLMNERGYKFQYEIVVFDKVASSKTLIKKIDGALADVEVKGYSKRPELQELLSKAQAEKKRAVAFIARSTETGKTLTKALESLADKAATKTKMNALKSQLQKAYDDGIDLTAACIKQARLLIRKTSTTVFSLEVNSATESKDLKALRHLVANETKDVEAGEIQRAKLTIGKLSSEAFSQKVNSATKSKDLKALRHLVANETKDVEAGEIQRAELFIGKLSSEAFSQKVNSATESKDLKALRHLVANETKDVEAGEIQRAKLSIGKLSSEAFSQKVNSATESKDLKALRHLVANETKDVEAGEIKRAKIAITTLELCDATKHKDMVRLDAALKQAGDLKMKEDHKHMNEARVALRECVLTALETAIAIGELETLNNFIAMAVRVGVDPSDKIFQRAKRQKVIASLDVERFRPKRQPTTADEVIMKMAKPEHLAYEFQRKEVIKSGGLSKCLACQGSGKMPYYAKDAAVKKEEKKRNEGKSSSLKRDDGQSGEGEPNVACWMCSGTGNAQRLMTSLTTEQLQDDIPCSICYCDSRYGISDECDHFYCAECIQMSLKAIMDTGQFPAYCPACRAESAGKKVPDRGLISPEALTYLERRDVITKDMQFRMMKQQLSPGDQKFFACPANCGKYLLYIPPSFKQRIMKTPQGPVPTSKPKPGLCECGCVFCMSCHAKLDPDKAGEHDCKKGEVKMDKQTEALLKKLGKKCPCCGNFLQKNGGCDIMMCGDTAHGNLLKAVKNGGCGHQFFWSSLKPAKTFFHDHTGKRRDGYITNEMREAAMKAAGIV